MKFLSGDPVTLSVTADGTYQTVDLSAHIPAEDQGNVELVMISTINAGVAADAGVRAVGSTHAVEFEISADAGQEFWLVKADVSDQVEVFLEAAGTWTVRFWGYLTSDEAVGFVDPQDNDFTPVSLGVWTDCDISTLTGADTALAAIVILGDPDAAGPVGEAGVRVNGSTDVLRPDQQLGEIGFHIIGVDGGEIFEANVSSTGIDVLVAGYIKANFTAITNMVDVTGSQTGVYEDIDLSGSIPVNNTFMAGLADHGGSSSSTSGLRQNGWTVDEQGECSRQKPFAMGIDANRVMEHNRSSAGIDLWLRGYGSEPAAGAGGGLLKIMMMHDHFSGGLI